MTSKKKYGINISGQKRKRRKLLEKSGGVCTYCGVKLSWKSCTLDHVIPKSKGGSTLPVNLVASCVGCNNKKGNMTPEEFRDVQS